MAVFCASIIGCCVANTLAETGLIGCVHAIKNAASESTVGTDRQFAICRRKPPERIS
jgi:hypothetical protein